MYRVLSLGKEFLSQENVPHHLQPEWLVRINNYRLNLRGQEDVGAGVCP